MIVVPERSVDRRGGRSIGGRACGGRSLQSRRVEHLIARAEIDAGRPVDVLVNNAVLVVDRCVDQDPDAIRTMFALNAVAPAQPRTRCSGMLERRRGAIVNIGSFAGITAHRPRCTAQQGRVGQYTSTLQRELRNSGVTATMVQPGEVAGTHMMEEAVSFPTIAAVSARLDSRDAPKPSRRWPPGSSMPSHAVPARSCSRSSAFHGLRELPSRVNDPCCAASTDA